MFIPPKDAPLHINLMKMQDGQKYAGYWILNFANTRLLITLCEDEAWEKFEEVKTWIPKIKAQRKLKFKQPHQDEELDNWENEGGSL